MCPPIRLAVASDLIPPSIARFRRDGVSGVVAAEKVSVVEAPSAFGRSLGCRDWEAS